MKKFFQRTSIALIVCALTAVTALADKTKSERVTFPDDIMVNGTLVKAGDYEVKFDEKTGEVAIVKNGKIVAKTSARVEARSDKAKDTSIRTTSAGDKVELIGITFGGSNQNLVLGTGGNSGR